MSIDLDEYRSSAAERARTDDLLRLLPVGRGSVLDIGARDGHFSRLLTRHFNEVIALDLEKPAFECEGIATMAGDVTSLDFSDGSFDCVFCTEVLEHIPDVQRACREIIRVARHEVIVGVPFRQDIRLGRTTCRACGTGNPPWGHVNTFDEDRLRRLFVGVEVRATSFVGVRQERTNAVSTWLMDVAGNPWGTYTQDEPCICCGARLVPPETRPTWRKVCSALAYRANRVQARRARPHANWIHVAFSKRAC